MNGVILITVLITGLSPGEGDLLDARAARPSLMDFVPTLQFEDVSDAGPGELGADTKHLSLSCFFGLIYPENTEMGEIEFLGFNFDLSDWTYYYNNGVGFGLRGSYLTFPALRIGGTLGYEYFDDKTLYDIYESGGTWYRDEMEFGDMHKVILGLSVDLQLPFKLPSTQWFKGGKNYIPGLVPYFGVELGAVYWGRVETTYFDDEFDVTTTDESIAPYVRFLFGGHLGCEYRLQESFGFFIELGYMVFTAPKRGKDMKRSVTGLDNFEFFDLYEIPFRAGVSVYF
jgi:hypothetical protein